MSNRPKYQKYDQRARPELKARLLDHLSAQRVLIQKCIRQATDDVSKFNLHFHAQIPTFTDSDAVMNGAEQKINEEIQNWGGIHVEQCKDKNIGSYQSFLSKAANRQDQSSWKITGDYFFAPYMKQARLFFYAFCAEIVHIDDSLRTEIQTLICLSFVNAIFEAEVRFPRTGVKALLRARTLVKSQGIHNELQSLHSNLKLKEFIAIAKQKRKDKENKTNIIATDFFAELKSFIHNEYVTQSQTVEIAMQNTQQTDAYEDEEGTLTESDSTKHSDISGEDHEHELDDTHLDLHVNAYHDSQSSITMPRAPPPPLITHHNSAKQSTKDRRFQSISLTKTNAPLKTQTDTQCESVMKRRKLSTIDTQHMEYTQQSNSSNSSSSSHVQPYVPSINDVSMASNESRNSQTISNYDDHSTIFSAVSSMSYPSTNSMHSQNIQHMNARNAQMRPRAYYDKEKYMRSRYRPQQSLHGRSGLQSSFSNHGYHRSRQHVLDEAVRLMRFTDRILSENEKLRSEVSHLRFLIQQKRERIAVQMRCASQYTVPRSNVFPHCTSYPPAPAFAMQNEMQPIATATAPQYDSVSAHVGYRANEEMDLLPSIGVGDQSNNTLTAPMPSMVGGGIDNQSMLSLDVMMQNYHHMEQSVEPFVLPFDTQTQMLAMNVDEPAHAVVLDSAFS